LEWCDLPNDVQDIICEATASSFLVESTSFLRFRFRNVGWMEVPYLIHYECILKPRQFKGGQFSVRPEIEIRVRRTLDAAFTHTNLFIESDISIQKTLLEQFKEIVYFKVYAIKIVRRDATDNFLECVKVVDGVQKTCIMPFWSKIDQRAIAELKQKLKLMFSIDLQHE